MIIYNQFLVTILFFICQHVQARNEAVTNTQELNREIFSETNIFYLPGSQVAVPLIRKSSAITSITKDRGPKGVYGWLPCFCLIGICNCCVDIQIRALNTRDTGCVTVSPLNEDATSIVTELSLNNKTLIQERVSFDNAPPLCVPFPPFPAISICVRLHQIMREGRNIKACVNFELRITGTFNPLWSLQFTCVRFGFSGISFFRPTTTPAPSGSVAFPSDNFESSDGQYQQQSPFEQQLSAYPQSQLFTPQYFFVQKYAPLSLTTQPLRLFQYEVAHPIPFHWFPMQTQANMWPVENNFYIDDPAPLCTPFPAFPLICGCIHFNKIRTHNGRIRGCARMEIRVTATDVILWDMQFSCFRIGTDGIVFNKPNGNKNKDKPNAMPSKPH